MAAPRKLTIKLRPVGAKPAAPAAAAPAAPTPAPAPAPVPPPAPEAPVVEEMPPIAEPSTTPVPEVKAETVAAQQAKRQTSRIELPPELTSAPMNAQGATIRLRPVSQAANPAPEDTQASTIRLKPISQTATPAPTAEDTQASKSKTARIALDSVLGGIQANTPLANTTQKTIKLKRAAAPAATGKSSPSMPITKSEAVGEDDKTIKINKRPVGLSIKKPTLGIKKPVTPDATADNVENLESLETLENLDDISSTPMMSAPTPVAAESGAHKIFTIIGSIAAAAAAIVGVMLWFTLQNQAASPDGSEPTGNTLHSFSMQRF